MNSSIRGRKITLQIISGFYLIASLFVIAVGIMLLLNADEITDKFLRTDIAPATIQFAIYLSYYLLIFGTLMVILSIFGIYNVAKENAGQVEAYGIIHVVLFVLNVLGLFYRFQFSTFFIIFISAAAVCLSFELADRFRQKSSNTNNSV